MTMPAATKPRSSRRFHVRALVTVPGQHSYSQSDMHADFRERVSRIPGCESSLLEKIQTIYDNSSVGTRHLELSIEEIDRQRQVSSWHPLFNKVLLSLGRRALERVFSGDVRAADCDGLVVVASNYDGFPGPSRKLAEMLGFRPDAVFYDLASLGCGGANHGINLAQMLLETGRCKSVCVLCVDAAGTHIQGRRYPAPPSISEVVGRVLPSDGAAAMILSVEPGARTAFSYGSIDFRLRVWPESTHYMVAETALDGEPFGQIHKDIRNRLVEEVTGLLDESMFDEPLFIHPGGIALVRRLADSNPKKLGKTAQVSTDVLRDNGNMTSPTVLFVLARALERGMPIEPRLRLLAFGPGVYTTLLCMNDVAST